MTTETPPNRIHDPHEMGVYIRQELAKCNYINPSDFKTRREDRESNLRIELLLIKRKSV